METDKPIVAKATLLQMFKTENLRLNAFLCTVIWWAFIDTMMTCNFWWKAFEFSFSQRKHIDSMMGFMCYYGHVQNTSNLGEGNVYKSYFLGALVEIPCWLVVDIFTWFDLHLTLFNEKFSSVYCLRSVPFIIAKMGRRWPLLFLFTCSGICGVVYGFIPDDLPR